MRQIDGKYSVIGEHVNSDVEIIKTDSREALPIDEPLILFRGKDCHVRRLMFMYREMCVESRCRPEHIAGIDAEIRKLEQFAADHPERMKVPD